MAFPIALYVNLSKNPDKIAVGPILNGETWQQAVRPAPVSGTVLETHLHFFDDSGEDGQPTRQTVDAAQIRLSARKTPGAEDLLIDVDEWTEAGEADSEYYTATIDWSVIPTTWNTNEESVMPMVDLSVEGRIVRIPMDFIRGAYDPSTPASNPQLYVKTTAGQVLTSQQKANVLANLGISASSGDIVSDGTITLANAGKVAVVTDLKEIGAGVAYDTFQTADTIAKRGANGEIAANGNDQPNTCVVHDSTVVTSAAGRLVKVAGDQDGMIEAGPDFSEDATAYTLVLRDGDGNINANGTTGSFNIAANLTIEGGDINAQSAVCTVGSVVTSSVTLNGVVGVAGVTLLSHGTTPTGIASYSTVYGVSGGIGIIDGNGTAYTLSLGGNVSFTATGRTLANAATNLAAFDAIKQSATTSYSGASRFATTTERRTWGQTGVTITPDDYWFLMTLARSLPFDTAWWSISAGAAPTLGGDQIKLNPGATTSATTIRGRYDATNCQGWQNGVGTTFDWSKPFAIMFNFMSVSMGGASIARLIFGKTQSSTTLGRGAESGAKTMGVEFAVNGANIEIKLVATNDTTDNTSSTVHSYTIAQTQKAIVIVSNGSGTASLYVDRTLITTATCATGNATAATRQGLHVELDNNGSASNQAMMMNLRFLDLGA